MLARLRTSGSEAFGFTGLIFEFRRLFWRAGVASGGDWFRGGRRGWDNWREYLREFAPQLFQ
jgi:hypothetical protein